LGASAAAGFSPFDGLSAPAAATNKKHAFM